MACRHSRGTIAFRQPGTRPPPARPLRSSRRERSRSGNAAGAPAVLPADDPAIASADVPHDLPVDASLNPSRRLPFEVLRRPLESARPALVGRDVRHVGHPRPVGDRGHERARQHVDRDDQAVLRIGRPPAAPPLSRPRALSSGAAYVHRACGRRRPEARRGRWRAGALRVDGSRPRRSEPRDDPPFAPALRPARPPSAPDEAPRPERRSGLGAPHRTRCASVRRVWEATPKRSNRPWSWPRWGT